MKGSFVISPEISVTVDMDLAVHFSAIGLDAYSLTEADLKRITEIQSELSDHMHSAMTATLNQLIKKYQNN